MSRVLMVIAVLVLPSPPTLDAQSLPKPPITTVKAVEVGHLEVVATVRTPEIANSISIPIHCDDQGNLYTSTDPFGVKSIRKLNAKGESAALFQPSSVTDLKLNIAFHFDVDGSGKVYQLAEEQKPPVHLIMYKSDGSYQGNVKLDPGFLWHASTLAVFRPSGALLVAGQRYDWNRIAVKLPFTGVFSDSGSLLREVKLEDDDAIHEMAASGDPRVVSPESPTDNLAFALSQMQAADDGNVYLMRWLSPAIVYAISPGGEVVRRFEVKAGDDNYKPDTMHISGNRMAVLFLQPQTHQQLIKVVDLEGKELATYEPSATGASALGGGFACYSTNPERFTFLESGDNNQLEIKLAEPR